MRSVVALAALALSASLDVASASRCKPDGPRVVTNKVVGGNFNSQALGNGEMANFRVTGSSSQNTVDGYTNDGSKETRYAELTARNANLPGKRERGVEPTAGIAQDLPALTPGSPYTVRFYYSVVSSDTESSCKLDAYFGGDEPFFSTGFFTPASVGGYNKVVQAVTVTASQATIEFGLTCVNGGSAVVHIDQVFVSNEVTPETIYSVVIDYGDDESSTDPGYSSLVLSETAATGAGTSINTTASQSTLPPSSTIPSASTATTGCPRGIAAPGACYDATPTASGSRCSKQASLVGTDTYSVKGRVSESVQGRELCLHLPARSELQGICI